MNPNLIWTQYSFLGFNLVTSFTLTLDRGVNWAQFSDYYKVPLMPRRKSVNFGAWHLERVRQDDGSGSNVISRLLPGSTVFLTPPRRCSGIKDFSKSEWQVVTSHCSSSVGSRSGIEKLLLTLYPLQFSVSYNNHNLLPRIRMWMKSQLVWMKWISEFSSLTGNHLNNFLQKCSQRRWN